MAEPTKICLNCFELFDDDVTECTYCKGTYIEDIEEYQRCEKINQEDDYRQGK